MKSERSKKSCWQSFPKPSGQCVGKFTPYRLLARRYLMPLETQGIARRDFMRIVQSKHFSFISTQLFRFIAHSAFRGSYRCRQAAIHGNGLFSYYLWEENVGCFRSFS